MFRYLQKDLPPTNYFVAVLNAIVDCYKLRRDLKRQGICSGITGLHHVEFARGGRPVGELELHHDRGTVEVDTTHPDSGEFVEEACRRGYRTLDL